MSGVHRTNHGQHIAHGVTALVRTVVSTDESFVRRGDEQSPPSVPRVFATRRGNHLPRLPYKPPLVTLAHECGEDRGVVVLFLARVGVPGVNLTTVRVHTTMATQAQTPLQSSPSRAHLGGCVRLYANPISRR